MHLCHLYHEVMTQICSWTPYEALLSVSFPWSPFYHQISGLGTNVPFLTELQKVFGGGLTSGLWELRFRPMYQEFTEGYFCVITSLTQSSLHVRDGGTLHIFFLSCILLIPCFSTKLPLNKPIFGPHKRTWISLTRLAGLLTPRKRSRYVLGI